MRTQPTTRPGRRQLRGVVLVTTAAIALTLGLGACGRDSTSGAAQGQGDAIADGKASKTMWPLYSTRSFTYCYEPTLKSPCQSCHSASAFPRGPACTCSSP